MTGELASDRSVIEVTGADREHFLQGLVTNDVDRLDAGLVYAALLTPQGKYLADFFLLRDGAAILIDVKDTLAKDLLKRLSMYKLRADVTLTETDRQVVRGLGSAPEGAFADPRHPALGWRSYGAVEPGPAAVDWDALRVQHMIPETGIELIPNDTFVLEAGFEALHGVDFKKGCYVGQEVTARMKHKTDLRKGLVRVGLSGTAPVGSEIDANGKRVGTLYTQSGEEGIAYVRFDRAAEGMTAGDATVRYPA